jgi:hypothetical protein
LDAETRARQVCCALDRLEGWPDLYNQRAPVDELVYILLSTTKGNYLRT